MTDLEILRSVKKEVAAGWTEAVFSTYPLETVGFLRTKNDPFTNPAAHMTREAANILYDAMIGEDVGLDEVSRALERFVKLRAVQKGEPSKSIGVLYLLKPVFREIALPKMLAAGRLESFLECEARLDTLALLAFDIYMRARETLAEARIKEIKNQHAQLARWAQKLEGAPLPGE